MAKLVHNSSSESATSALDLFGLPPTQSSVIKSKIVDTHPITSLTDEGPIEFKISGNGDAFIDLSQTELYLKFKVTKSDGSNLDAGSKTTVINYPIASMFSQVDVTMGGKLISASSNTYAHRGQLEAMLNYGKEAQESQLSSALFYKDTAGHMDDADVTADPIVNKGTESRNKWIAQSHVVEIQGRVHADIFNQDKLILNGVDINVKFHRHKNTFAILSEDAAPAAHRITILDAVLYVKKVFVAPSHFNAINTVLKDSTVKYPITRVSPKVFTIAQGKQSENIDNAFLGELPKRIVICMTDNDAFNGHYKKNPFNFQHYKLTHIGVNVNGEDAPQKPLKLDFDTKQYISAYNTLFAGTGKLHADSGVGISRDEYASGYSIFVFDLTPFENGEHFDLKTEGSLNIELIFKQALPRTINVIVYAEYDAVIEIDSNRNVIKDFHN